VPGLAPKACNAIEDLLGVGAAVDQVPEEDQTVPGTEIGKDPFQEILERRRMAVNVADRNRRDRNSSRPDSRSVC